MLSNKNIGLKSERGSIYYLAPEMIKKNYNHKVDIWSAGVIFYILVTGTPPFNSMVKGANGNMGIDSTKIKELILKGKVSYKNKIFKKYDPEVKEIIKKMLTLNPKKRSDAKEILKHPWFKKKKIKNKKQEEGTPLMNSS